MTRFVVVEDGGWAIFTSAKVTYLSSWALKSTSADTSTQTQEFSANQALH